METEDQQEATVRVGGQTGGWKFSGDGSFDATENWRLIQNARVRNETAEEAEDPRTEPISVARDMIEAQQEDGCMAAERAAQILEERFLQWDRDEQDSRRQVFMEQVQEMFKYTSVEEGWYETMNTREEEWVEHCGVYIGNLAGCVTEEMLAETFEQIGLVLEAGMETEGCGWVQFQTVEDAVEAVQRFDRVVFAGQAMVCGSSESAWEAQADYCDY